MHVFVKFYKNQAINVLFFSRPEPDGVSFIFDSELQLLGFLRHEDLPLHLIIPIRFQMYLFVIYLFIPLYYTFIKAANRLQLFKSLTGRYNFEFV